MIDLIQIEKRERELLQREAELDNKFIRILLTGFLVGAILGMALGGALA